MPVDMAEVEKLRTYENPTYGYRMGENGDCIKQLFDCEVLPSGWVDSPTRIEETKNVQPGTQASTESGAVDDNGEPMPGEPLAAPYDDYAFGDLRSEFMRRNGKGPPPGTSKADLVLALEDWDTRPDEDTQ